jgi:hypothetical protein
MSTDVTFTAGSNVWSSTSTVLPDGGIFVAWQGTENSDTRIRAQLFDADGNPVGEQILIDADTTTNPEGPVVTVLSDGSVVVSWIQVDGSAYGVNARVISSDGEAVTDVLQVNTTTLGNQSMPSVTALDNGGFVVTFQSGSASSSTTIHDDGSQAGIRAQIYDAEGNPVGEEFLVNEVTAGAQTDPSVTAVEGGFVVVYGSNDADGTSGLRARLFTDDGTPLGGEFEVTGDTAGEAIVPEVVARPEGGFLVVWQTLADPDLGTTTLMARLFDADGNPTGDAVDIGGLEGVYHESVSLVALPEGGYVVVYNAYDSDWASAKVYGQLLDADGNPVGGTVVIAESDGAYLTQAKAHLAADGSLVVSWQAGDGTITVKTMDVWEAGEANAVPEDLALSASTVRENAAAGTVIGTLSATDGNGDDLTYTLEDDADGLFALVTEDGVTRLVTTAALDHEAAGSHEVTVTVSDGKGGETSRTFTVAVTDVDEAPVDIALSNTVLSESARTGSAVGTLSATDPEGGAITWSLVSGAGDNNDKFALKTNDDGTVSVVLKSPLDHENSKAGAPAGGLYSLVVTATDEAGNVTTETITISATDDPFKLSSVPTGKDYLSVIENVEGTTLLGYVMQFDSSFDPETAEVVGDDSGLFSIETLEVEGETRAYLVANGPLDHEAAAVHEVTIRATDANGVSYDKTFEVNVLDAAEAGDEARGTITIDANTLSATGNGGVNWDTYLDEAYAAVVSGLPTFLGGNGWSASDPASELLYTGRADGSLVSLSGSNFVYNWTDPVSGEDVHVLSGSIDTMTFGTGDSTGITDPELTISGLDLESGTGPLERIFGEVNIFAQTWMHGPDATTPADIHTVKAVIASYAQNFIGSDARDTYTGTLFDDTIDAKAGDDTLAGGGGDDVIDGGSGDDVVRYAGDLDDYEVTRNDDGTVTVADTRDIAGNEGTDTLTSIARLTFADGTMSLDEFFNTAPEKIAISGRTVAEDAAEGTVVGTLSATDADGDALAWTITGGNDVFGLVTEDGATRLIVMGDLDYEAASRVTVTVTASDGAAEVSKTLTIKVTDVLEKFVGDGEANKLKGGIGADYLKGNGGKDTLVGQDGDDILLGGRGADKLTGGKGADSFLFKTGDSGATKKLADVVRDFAKADTLDLSRWDADATKKGDQAFDFIGRGKFGGEAGELRFVRDEAKTWIEGDTDGDGKADFLIRLDGSIGLKEAFFEL